MAFLENGITQIMDTLGSSTIVNLGIFIVSVLAIKFVLKGILHVLLAGVSGVAFLLISNQFLGTSYPFDLETVIFFAAFGAIVYLAASLVKHVMHWVRR